MSQTNQALLIITLLALAGISQAFITGCATLGTPVNGIENCAACLAGYIITADNLQCNICPLGCSQCSSTNTCITCSAGNYLNNGLCLSCGAGCNACNGPVCTLCVVGYTLTANNICISCIPNCVQCTSNGVCQKCADGYIVTNNNQGAQQCVWASYNNATTPIIVWLVVIFIACCAPFVLFCFLCYRPSYHTGAPGSAYVPLAEKPVVVIPAPVIVTQQQAQPIITRTLQTDKTTKTVYPSGY